MKTADLIKTVSANNALMAENTQKVFEAGKAQGGGGVEIEMGSTVSNTLELSKVLFAGIPENHLAMGYLTKLNNESGYINNQILFILRGADPSGTCSRWRDGRFANIMINNEYDAAVTIGDVYTVLDLGEVI